MESAEIVGGTPIQEQMVTSIKSEPIDDPPPDQTSCHEEIVPQNASGSRSSELGNRLDRVIKREQSSVVKITKPDCLPDRHQLSVNYDYEPEVKYECLETEPQVDPLAVDSENTAREPAFACVKLDVKEEEELHIVDNAAMQNAGDFSHKVRIKGESEYVEETEEARVTIVPIAKVIDARHTDNCCPHKASDLYPTGECDKCTFCVYNKRPFKCEVCLAKFNQSFHLKRHMAVHARMRKFRCKHCSLRFHSDDKLRKHEVSLHSGKVSPS